MDFWHFSNLGGFVPAVYRKFENGGTKYQYRHGSGSAAKDYI